MGSSGESNLNGIDASVGGLVWVRRRNGSWWPGRIMGLHELSESCLVSPRSGTPVKLLGREDASVSVPSSSFLSQLFLLLQFLFLCFCSYSCLNLFFSSLTGWCCGCDYMLSIM